MGTLRTSSIHALWKNAPTLFYLSVWTLTGKRIKKAKESAISEHLLQYDSPLFFDDFDILASDSNKFKLLIKKSSLNKRDNSVLNRTAKSFPLDILTCVYFL